MINETKNLVYKRLEYNSGLLSHVQTGEYDREITFSLNLDRAGITAYNSDGTRASGQDGYTEHMSGFECHVPYDSVMGEYWNIRIGGGTERYWFSEQPSSLKEEYWKSHRRFLQKFRITSGSDMAGLEFTDKKYFLINANRTGVERPITISTYTDDGGPGLTEILYQKSQSSHDVYGAMVDGVFTEHAVDWDVRVDKNSLPYTGGLINIYTHASQLYRTVWEDGFVEIPHGDSVHIPTIDHVSVITNDGEHLASGSSPEWYFNVPEDSRGGVVRVVAVTDTGLESPAVEITLSPNLITFDYALGDIVPGSATKALAIGSESKPRTATCKIYLIRIIKDNGVEISRNNQYSELSASYTFPSENLTDKEQTSTQEVSLSYEGKRMTKEGVVFTQEAATLVSESYTCSGFSVDKTSFKGYSQTPETFTVNPGSGAYNTTWRDSMDFRKSKSDTKTVTIGSENVFWRLKAGNTFEVATNISVDGVSSARTGYVYPIVNGTPVPGEKKAITQAAQFSSSTYMLTITPSVSSKSVESSVQSVTITASLAYVETRQFDSPSDSWTGPSVQLPSSLISATVGNNLTSLSPGGSPWTFSMPVNSSEKSITWAVYFSASYNGVSAENRIEVTQAGMTYYNPVIKRVVADLIPASGGSSSKGTAYYTQGTSNSPNNSTEKSVAVTFQTVTANSLGTTETEQKPVATRSITITANGKASAAFTATIYQQANTVTSYGSVSAPTISQSANVPAAGATITTSSIVNYVTLGASAQTITYTSGSTRAGVIKYGWSGNSTSIASLGTTEKNASSVAINTLTYTATGEGNKTNRATISSLTQSANAKTSISYGEITISSVTCSDVPAGGGSITSGAVSYSQPRTQNYTSGATSALTALTSGATVTWSGGVSNYPSLGGTVKDRASTGKYLSVTVSMNGKYASSSALVYQASNSVTKSTYSVDVWNLGYSPISGNGGSQSPTLDYTIYRSDTYTSGYSTAPTATTLSATRITYSTSSTKFTINASTGVVSKATANTSYTNEVALGDVTATVYYNSVSGTKSASISQAAAPVPAFDRTKVYAAEDNYGGDYQLIIYNDNVGRSAKVTYNIRYRLNGVTRTASNTTGVTISPSGTYVVASGSGTIEITAQTITATEA